MSETHRHYTSSIVAGHTNNSSSPFEEHMRNTQIASLGRQKLETDEQCTLGLVKIKPEIFDDKLLKRLQSDRKWNSGNKFLVSSTTVNFKYFLLHRQNFVKLPIRTNNVKLVCHIPFPGSHCRAFTVDKTDYDICSHGSETWMDLSCESRTIDVTGLQHKRVIYAIERTNHGRVHKFISAHGHAFRCPHS